MAIKLVNDTKANREVSREFGRGATFVTMTVEVGGKNMDIEVRYDENAVGRMQRAAEVREMQTGTKPASVTYISCKSDADDWADLEF